MADTADLVQRGYRYALALALNRADAEDLLHDGWSSVLAARRIPTAPYLFRAIRSRWIDRARRERIVRFERLEFPDDLPALEEAVAQEEIWAAMATLREEEREALFLTVVDGWSTQDVADHTGRPRNTILSLLHRGRAKVRQWFAAHTAKEALR